MNRYEGWAEARNATEILVAGRLVDLALAPKFGFERKDADAIGFDRAISAAFANRIVDEGAFGRVGIFAALAATALFGSASLIIDQDRRALLTPEALLDQFKVFAVPDRHAVREPGIGRIFFRLVRHHDDPADAFGRNLAADLRHRQRPVDRLAARHRDSIVVEDLVCDVGSRRDSRADRHQPRMEIGAVADILENVRHVREGRDAIPVGPFRTHMDRGDGIPVHPHSHVAAPDPGHGMAAFGHLGRAVVRASRTEIGATRDAGRRIRPSPDRRLIRGNRLPEAAVDHAEPVQPCSDRARNLPRIEHAVRREQRRSVGCRLSRNRRAKTRFHRVEKAGRLILDQRPLLFDEQDFLIALHKGPHLRGFDRPGEPRLVKTDAESLATFLIDPEPGQRLKHVEPGLSCRDDPEPLLRSVPDNPVDAVGCGKSKRHGQLIAHQPPLGFHWLMPHADMNPARRSGNTLGLSIGGRQRRQIDRRRGLKQFVHALESHPEPRVARHRPAKQAELQKVRDGRRIENRDRRGDHGLFRLVRQRGRFGAVIVTERHQHATMPRGSRQIGMLERIPAAIDARAFPIPECEYPIVARAGKQAKLLRSPDCGGGKILVHARLEDDAVPIKKRAGAPQFGIICPDRRAAIAGNIARRVNPHPGIEPALFERKTDKRLRPGQQDPAGRGRVFVVEPNFRKHNLHLAHPAAHPSALPPIWREG